MAYSFCNETDHLTYEEFMDKLNPHYLNFYLILRILFMCPWKCIEDSMDKTEVKLQIVNGDMKESCCKIVLPKIIIYDADNNIIKPVEDLDSNAYKVTRIGNRCITRDKLPSGSNAFQQLLQEMLVEEDADTATGESDSKHSKSANEDKDMSRSVATGGEINTDKSNMNTETTNKYTDDSLHPKERRKSVTDNLRPQISSLTGTKSLHAFWNEINGIDNITCENEGISFARRTESLSRAKSDLSQSDESCSRQVTTTSCISVNANEHRLKPQTKRSKQRRKSAPESQSPRLPGIPLARERSVHWNRPTFERNSGTVLPKIKTRSRHRSDGALNSRNAVLKN